MSNDEVALAAARKAYDVPDATEAELRKTSVYQWRMFHLAIADLGRAILDAAQRDWARVKRPFG